MTPGTTLPERFWQKVRATDSCWIWTGAVQSKGYGSYSNGGVRHSAHRLAYEDAFGQIPDGMQIDHRCRVRQCVNPAHLDAVTAKENARRSIHTTTGWAIECQNGHPLDDANIYEARRANGKARRECKACRNERARRQRAAQKTVTGVSS